MDKRNLVEGLQKAFNTDDRQRNTSDTSDVEYKENTNTLYIKKQRTYNMEENMQSATAMSEEEIFKRLHEEAIRSADRPYGCFNFCTQHKAYDTHC